MKRTLFVSLLALVLAFGLAGCGDDDPSSGGGQGWPSSRLSTYKLNGLTEPANSGEVNWTETREAFGSVIAITFTAATTATDTHVVAYFNNNNNDWDGEGATTAGGYSGSWTIIEVSGSYAASYTRSGAGATIAVTKADFGALF